MPEVLTIEARIPSGLHRLWQQALDWVFPPACAGCGRVDVAWCSACTRALEAVPMVLLTRSLEGLEALAATGLHEGQLQAAVQALKYDFVTTLATPLAERLQAALALLAWKPDLIVAVPSPDARLKARGYNQALLLADALAGLMAVPCNPSALVRTRETTSQVGLSREERLQNVAGAFAADAVLVSGRAMLIVDDVCTTGATLAACAQALNAAGAKAVYGLTVSSPPLTR